MNDDRLAAGDAVILLADLQEGIVNVATTNDQEQLRRSSAALVRVAALFEIPVIISVVPTMNGTVAPLLDELLEAYPAAEPLTRNNASAFADVPAREAIEATGRKTLIIGGVATEIAVQLPALAARAAGYRVLVAVDACSALDERTEDAAFRRMTASGIVTTSVAAIIAEMAGDFRTPGGKSAIEILGGLLRPRETHSHSHQH